MKHVTLAKAQRRNHQTSQSTGVCSQAFIIRAMSNLTIIDDTNLQVGMMLPWDMYAVYRYRWWNCLVIPFHLHLLGLNSWIWVVQRSSNGPKAEAENLSLVYTGFLSPRAPSECCRSAHAAWKSPDAESAAHWPRYAEAARLSWTELPGPYQIQTTWCGSSWKTLPPLSARGPRCRSPRDPQLSCKANNMSSGGRLSNHRIQLPRKTNATEKLIPQGCQQLRHQGGACTVRE